MMNKPDSFSATMLAPAAVIMWNVLLGWVTICWCFPPFLSVSKSYPPLHPPLGLQYPRPIAHVSGLKKYPILPKKGLSWHRRKEWMRLVGVLVPVSTRRHARLWDKVLALSSFILWLCIQYAISSKLHSIGSIQYSKTIIFCANMYPAKDHRRLLAVWLPPALSIS